MGNKKGIQNIINPDCLLTFTLQFLSQHGTRIHVVSVVDVVAVQGGDSVQPLSLHQPHQADLPSLPVDDVADLGPPQWLAALRVDDVGEEPGELGLLPPLRQNVQPVIWGST